MIATLARASTSPQVEQLAALAVPRTAHTATVLSDGRVLIVGGRDPAGTALAAAEIFDPETETSAAIGAMLVPRTGHTATLLSNGRVLIAGGTNATGSLTSAEIFDPSALEAGFRLLPANLGAARTGHTATLLSSGKVLIAGGDDAGTAEIFDPATETFSSTLLLMAHPRSTHTASLFSGDTVLLAGGQTDSMEFFNAADQTFTLDSNKMSSLRTGGAAITLGDTRVLFFGGDINNTLEEFDLSTDTLILQASMDAPASTATRLANDKILVLRPDLAGVYNPDGAASAAGTELEVISDPAVTILQRTGQTATELSGDKKILVVGGENAQHQPVLQIASFNPARIWTDKDDYLPDDPVLLFGSGWKPNEDVYLFAVDSETEQWTYESTVAADDNGSFAIEPYFIVQLRHQGVLFDVNAVGAQSNMQAAVEFTDSGIANVVVAGAQTPSLVVPGNSVSYGSTAASSVNVTFNGNNNTCSVTLSASGLPAGATATFNPSSFSSTGAQMNSLLTVSTTAAVTPGTYNFTVTANAGGNCQGSSKSTTATLVVANPPSKYVVTSSDNNPAAGSAVTISAQLADTGGLPVPIAGKVVTWSKTGAGGSFSSATSTTNSSGIATVTFTTGTTAGTVYTITATDNSTPTNFTGTSGNITTKAGAASKLALSGSTADLAAGTTRQLTATIQDANGNTVTSGADSSLSVNFAKTSGTGTVTGLTSASASAGVVTLTVTGSQAGSITITASATGSGGALAAGTGNPITFNVVPGVASKIALSGSTVDLTSGSTRTLTATIQDSAGNTVTTGADSALSVTFAKSAGTGNVSGLSSVNAVAGVASLTVTGTTAGSVTITASATGSGGALAAGAGNPVTFNVLTATLHHFGIASIASPQTAGTAFNVTITAQDINNNTVTSYDGNGFKAVLTSTGTFAGAPQITTPAFTAGVVTQSVTITNTGNFTITATGSGTNSNITGTSNSFQVNPGAASKLAFIQQPTTATAGQTIAPPVTVQIQDANGNLTNSTASVAIAIGTNPSTGTLSGTTPVATVNGVATFNDLSINKGGTGYTLQATSTGLTAATSAAFTINNPAPTLASIAPDNGNLSDTLDVVFNGTNYISGVSSVSFGPNITVNTVTVNSGTKITANITIGSGAAVGPRNVSVTNATPGGGTATLVNGFTVNNPATTTVVTSSSPLNTSTYGDSVIFTATVSSASGTPTGSVTFYDSATCSGTVLAGPTNLVNGQASFSTSSLSAPGHTITACYSPTGSYQASNGSVTQTVNKANASFEVTGYNVTYDGQPHTASGSATGVNGEDLSGLLDLTGTTHTNAGTYNDTWTFAGNNNYNAKTNGTVTDKITAASATVHLGDLSQTYDGTPKSATATTTPPNLNVTFTYSGSPTPPTNAGSYPVVGTIDDPNYTGSANGTLVIGKANATITVTPYDTTYDGVAHTATGMAKGVGGVTLTGLDLSGTTHTNAGTYTDSWTFTDSTGNYNDTSSTVTDKIAKANATINVTPYDVTYDGNAHTATGSAKGVNNETLTGLDLSGTTHTNAGTYTDSWSFTDSTGNYNNDSSTITDKIAKANATINVTPYDVTYDGNAHTATGSAKGVNNETLTGLDLSGTTHTNAGTYTDSWTFMDSTGNYNDTGSTVTDKIAKANATINVTPYDVTYDGNAHTATGSAKGINNETLTGLDLSGTTHTNAGSYTDSWTFTDSTGNYNNDSSTITDKIAKANATIIVTPYDVTYDGNAHTATGSAKGINNETLTGLDLSGTTHTNAGTYTDSWTFTDSTGNYNDTSSTVTDKIAKANVTINVTQYDVTYDGNAHTATGSAKGVNNEILTGLDLSGTTHTNAGSYTDSWTFTDSTGNYNNDSSTVTDKIAKANATINVTPYSVTYDGNEHTATGSATGVNGETLTGLDLSGTKHTNAGTYADSWTFTNANYKDAGDTLNDQIAKANANITVTPYHVTYDGDAHTASGSAIGVKGESLSGLALTGTTHTNAGTYNGDQWTFTDVTGNYNNANSTVDNKIDKATAVIAVTPYTVTYDGLGHTATGSATGVKGEVLSGLDLSGTTHTNAGTYNGDGWSFTDTTGNYNNANSTVNDKINKAALTVKAEDKQIVLNAALPTFTVTYSGFVPGESASNLGGTLGFTPTTSPTAVGTFPITPSGLTSNNYNITFTVGTLTVKYAASGIVLGSSSHAILQPINVDGSSVFKSGSTVPAKFRVSDAAGNSIGTSGVVTSFKLIAKTSDPGIAVNEDVTSTTPDTAFRWDPTGMQWIFNVSTKGMAPSVKYTYLISLNDGSTIQFSFALK